MGAPSGGKGGLGWAILAAALAVPGFLFYNWWSHLKTENERGVAAKARSRAEGVFQTAPASGRLVNPMAASTAPASGAAVAAAPGAARPTAAAVAAPPPATPPAFAPAAPSEAAPPVAAPTVGAPQPSFAAVAASSSAAVVLSRDPMMSPLDQVRIQEAQIEAAARAQALLEEERRRNARKHAPPPKPKPIETKIELQGIVAGASGESQAIINGQTMTAGEKFSVEGYSGKVVVRKISATDVTLEYSGRKFKLNMTAE